MFSNLSGTNTAMLSRVCIYMIHPLVSLCPMFDQISYLFHNMSMCYNWSSTHLMCSVHLVAPQYYVQYWVEYVNIQDVFSLLHALCLSTLHISQYAGVLELIKSTFNVFSNLSGTTVCAMLSRVWVYTRFLMPCVWPH